MSKELCLAALLTSYGNVHLHDGLSRADEEALAALDRRLGAGPLPVARLQIGQDKARPPAAALRDWLGGLKKRGVSGLWLFGGLDSGANGSSSGGNGSPATGRYRGVIYLDGERPSALLPEWGPPGRKSGREVIYRPVEVTKRSTLPALRIDQAARMLEKHIGLARSSPAARRYNAIDEHLATAGRAMSLSRRSDWLPWPGYLPDAHRLLEAAAAAWVFDDDAPWNQLWFDTEEESRRHYELTRGLHAAIVGSFVAAANSFPFPVRATP